MAEALRSVNSVDYEDCESAVLSLLSPAPELGQQDDGQALTYVERTEAEELVEMAELFSLLRMRSERLVASAPNFNDCGA